MKRTSQDGIQAIYNPVMCLITRAQMRKLKEAGPESTTPIVKLFGGPLTWLVTRIDEAGVLWGYADISHGQVEYGTLCFLNELPTLKDGWTYINRDKWFEPNPEHKYLEMQSLSGI